MNAMLRAYLARWGASATPHGDAGSNGPCPFCGDTSSGYHRSDRFVIWADRAEGLGRTCAEHGVTGVFWCRQCGETGDSVAYFMKAEGLSFPDACAECGITLPSQEASHRRRPAPAEPSPRPFEGRAASDPGDLWRAQAEKLAAEAAAALPASSSALQWLRDRHGITEGVAARNGLGVLAGEGGRDCRFRARSAFGLPDKTSDDGRPVRSIRIPRGLAIVSRDRSGRIGMFRVRRPAGDIARDGRTKYWELPGGTKTAHVIPPEGRPPVTAWIVVEGELDAMLLHAAAGGGIGAMAMRSSSNHPDAEAHALLDAADVIIVCLDGDEAGRKGTSWWLATYRQAVDRPVPGFKDPGDAAAAGFDLRGWLRTVLPASIAMPPDFGDAASSAPQGAGDAPQSVRNDGEKFSEGGLREGTGSVGRGCGGRKEDIPSSGNASSVSVPSCPYRSADDVLRDGPSPEWADLLTPEAVAGLRESCPRSVDFGAVPESVLAMAVLWRGVRVAFRRLAPAEGGGWEWDTHLVPGRMRGPAFGRLMRLTSDPWVVDWLMAHTAPVITGVNLLRLF